MTDSASVERLLDRLWLRDASGNSCEQATALYDSFLQTPALLKNFINGTFQDATEDDLSYEAIPSYNPQTGKIFLRLPNSSPSSIDFAVQSAHAAFPSWSKTPKSARSSLLTKVADLIHSRRDTFAAWESIDQGKTFARAQAEVDRAIANFRYFATYILHDESAARFTDDGKVLTYEHRSPLGVVALISPWNLPLYLLSWKIAPALAFGNTAVAKPSEITSLTAFLLADVFREAGVPHGVLNIIFGAGLPTGKALVNHPLVRGVSFTGGTATGLQIRRDTVDDIGKHLSLELGGKNPTLVFADAELDAAVKTAAAAAFENQGEICLCGSRIYVERAIYANFVTSFTSYVKETYRIGGKVGAVVSLPHYRKIRSYLERAKQEGAKFQLSEIPPETPEAGYWINPTILTDLLTSSEVVRDEIFGPVVTINVFEGEEEAIRLANDNPNGLAAVVLTRDGARMRRVGEQIDAGMVWINSWLVRELGTPFGGFKASGVGREGGPYSRDVFTNVRTMHIPM